MPLLVVFYYIRHITFDSRAEQIMSSYFTFLRGFFSILASMVSLEGLASIEYKDPVDSRSMHQKCNE